MTKQGLFQPLGLAAVLAVGFMGVWVVAAEWGVELGVHVLGTDPQGGQLVFQEDGTPLVRGLLTRHESQQFCDLEGNPVPGPENEFGNGFLICTRLPAALPTRSPAGVPWNQRLRSFADGSSPAVYWYFVTDGRAEGTGHFVGYDSQTNARVGHLGTAGFRAGPLPPDERFPSPASRRGSRKPFSARSGNIRPRNTRSTAPGGGRLRGCLSTWDVYVLGRDSRIYHADLRNRTMHVTLAEPRLRSAAVVHGPPDSGRGMPSRLAARTDDAVLVLGEHGQVLRRYPIPEALRGQDLTFGETTAGEAVLYGQSPPDSLATSTDYRIFWVAPDGRSREREFTLRGSPGDGMPVLGGVVMPSPLVLGGYVGTSRPRELLEAGLAPTYPSALGRALAEFWPALALAQLLAAGLAVLCHRRQVRYGASGAERAVWSLFVLVLGLPGWLAYRFGRSWPVLEACAACNVAVPRDRGCCARCTAEFPRPALKGTEVFA